MLFYAKLPVLIFRNVLVLIFRLQTGDLFDGSHGFSSALGLHSPPF